MAYRVVTRDGVEHGPLTVDTLLDWLDEGRVDADSMVYIEETSAWTRLGDLLEVGREAVVVDAHEPPPGRPAAGYALLANGGLAFAGTSFLLAERLLPGGAAVGYAVAGIDLALGLGLVFGPRAFVALGLARAIAGGLGFGVAMPLLAGGGPAVWALGAMHLALAAALVGLLRGARPMGLLLGCLAASWLGIGGVHVFGLVLPEHAARRAVKEAAQPGRELSDEAAGLTLKAPDGWVLLKPGSRVLEAPAGIAAAVHEESGCAAVVRTEEGASRGAPEEAVGSALLRLAAGAERSQVEPGAATALGGLPAWRAEGSFERGGLRQRSAATVAIRADDRVELLTWCGEARFEKARELLRALETGIALAPEGGARRQALARQAEETLGFVSGEVRGILVTEAVRRRLRPAELEAFAIAMAAAGVQRADPQELAALEELVGDLLAALPEADSARLERYRALLARGARPAPAEASGLVSELLAARRAASGLSPGVVETFERSLTAALLLGLNGADRR